MPYILGFIMSEQLNGHDLSVMDIDPEAWLLAICNGCEDLGWNALLHQLTNTDNAAFAGMVSILEGHAAHYGHIIELVEMTDPPQLLGQAYS